MPTKRVLAIASGGGHWIELMQLKPALEGHEVVWCTVDRAYQAHVAGAPFYVVSDATRWDRLRLLRSLFEVACVVWKVRPDVVLSTGALPGWFGIVFGKIMGAKTIWLDSLANAERLSMAGAWARPFADLWLTQSPSVARPSGPHYFGTVIG
ncbi:MAG: hypothetical protein NZM37_13080 [Sandaracinaceae bacterium]|nr:hypothetical protein [Sandaracinaceae bacterium]MDW8245654.1 hypothetical protein [Sandaracinaceae bacterium]